MSEEESCPDHPVEAENKERVAVVLHESKLEKAFRAVCLNGAILAVSLSLALIGSGLLDLKDHTKTRIDEVTKIFVGRGMGFLVGSISSNYLLSQANQACWITFALIILAVTMATVPSCFSLALLTGTLFMQGAACGIIKAGCGFICQNHFSRADVAWGRMLFVSYGIGSLLGPVLLLPFANVAVDGTPRIISLHYNEEVHVRTSTAVTHMVPARRGLIAPNILARLYRRRRNAEEKPEILSLLENVTENGIIETFAGFPFENLSKTDAVKSQSALNYSTRPLFPEAGSKSTTRELLINQKKTGLIETMSENDTNHTTASPHFSLFLSSSLPAAAVPLANVSASSSTTTTPKPVPKKPLIANGEILSSEHKVADSSKFRNQIRQSINNNVPEPPNVPSSSSTSPAFVTPNFSMNTSFPKPSSSPASDLQQFNITTFQTTVESAIQLSATRILSYGSSLSSQKQSASPNLSTSTSSPTTLRPSTSLSSHLPSLSPTRPSMFPQSPNHNKLSPSSSFPATTASPALASSKPTAQATKVSSEMTSNSVKQNEENPSGKAKLGLPQLTKYSYWLSALVIGLAATCFAFYWVLCPRVHQVGLSCNSVEALTNDSGRAASNCRFPSVVIATTFHILYAGLEVSFAILVTLYAVIELNWSWWFGVLLSVVYWGSFAICRLVTFVSFRYLHQSLVMLGGLLMCIVAGGTFLSLRHGSNLEFYTSGVLIWVLIGALGFGMSAILPGGMAEIDKFLPRHSELFQVLGASLGEMILPPVAGIILTMYDTIWLTYLLLAVFVLCLVNAIVIRVFVVRSAEGRVPRSSRSLPSLEQDDLEDVLTNTNDETELLAKIAHSRTGSPLNVTGNGSQAMTQSAIQSLMKNISSVKKD